MKKGITNAGKEYLAKCLSEKIPVNFSKVKIGDGTITGSENIEILSDIKSYKTEAQLLSVKKDSDRTVLITQFDNNNIVSGFFAKEIGIYVRDAGKDILFYYINSQEESSWVSSKETSPVKLKFNISLSLSNAESIIVNWTGKEIWVDVQFLTEKLKEYYTKLEINEKVELINQKIQETKEEILLKAERLPIGSVLDYPANATIPAGYLPLDGRKILSNEYSELYKILPTNSTGEKYLPKIISLVETGENENGKWRIYSDGYLEQWGKIHIQSGSGTINMPKAFKDLAYIVSGSHYMTYAIHGYGVEYLSNQQFKIYGTNYENSQTQWFTGDSNWKATGYTNQIPSGATIKIIKALNINQTESITSPIVDELNNKIDSNRRECQELKTRLDNYIPVWG